MIRAHAVALAVALVSVSANGQNFRAPRQVPIPGSAIGVLVADVNGDGVPDILYQDNSTAAGSIRVLLGQQTGDYVAGPTLNKPAAVGGCRVLDANHDGKPDLACVNQIDVYDITIATFLGVGDGSFQAPIYSGSMQSDVSLGNGFNPWLYPPADINNDGYPDLIVEDYLDKASFVLLGDGTGQFKVASLLRNLITIIGVEAHYVVTDLNGDGKPDLFWSDGPSAYLGNGDGTFHGGGTFPLDADCVLHDMDGDGHPDAVCSHYGLNTAGDLDGSVAVMIYHGNPDGSFNPTPLQAKSFGNPVGGRAAFIGALTIADLNNDGYADILGYSTGGLTVLLAQPGLTFADPVHYAIGDLVNNQGLTVQFADMNRDGSLDVVACGPHAIYITYGTTKGTFEAPLAYPVANVLLHATVADFNGDGIPDIASTGDQAIALALGNGDGTFRAPTNLPNGNQGFGDAHIVHGDFHGNGKQDLLASASSPTPFLLSGHGDGTFSAPQIVTNWTAPQPLSYPQSVFDLNKDGRDDILAIDSSHLYASLSNGDGTFTTITSPIPLVYGIGAQSQTFPVLADFNKDGKVDSAYGLASNVYVLKGHGDGSFDPTGVVLPIPPFESQPPQYPAAISTGDFDHDGNSDIALLAQIGAGVDPFPSPIATVAFIYYGKGDGTFSAPVVAGVFDRNYAAIFAADVNHDGLDDLVLQTKYVRGPNIWATGDSIGVVQSMPGRVFGPESNYYAGESEWNLTIADVNRDGYPDLLNWNDGKVVTMDGSSVTELLNLVPPSTSNAVPTTTVVTTSSKSVTAGASVTFTAVVSASSGSGPAPTGTIRFADQTGVSAVVPVVAASATSARATFTTTRIAIGSDTMSATYSGDTEYSPSTGLVSETVTGYNAVMTLTPAANPANAGDADPLTITVANASGVTAPTPGGYIQLTENGASLAGPYNLTNGSIRIDNIAFVVPGSYTFVGTYSGDNTHASATGSSTVSVEATPTVVVTPSLNALTTAQNLNVTVSVLYAVDTAPVATGSVVLSGGGYTSNPSILSKGVASFTIPAGALAQGTDTLTVTFAPDITSSGIYLAASGTASVTVNPAPPSFTISGESINVARGATTGNTTKITASPVAGFTGQVSLAAKITSGPAGAQDIPTASFGTSSPISIIGTTPASATLTVFTTAPSTTVAYRFKPRDAGLALAGILLLGMGLIRRRPGWFGFLVMAVALCGGLVSCGGGAGKTTITDPGTTPGTYSITITGTGGNVSSTTTITLVVN